MAELTLNGWSPDWKDHWPKSIPLPTDAEFAVAEERYWEEGREWERKTGKVDMSDGGTMGLKFMMTTYNQTFWLPYFFPKRKEEFIANFEAELDGKLSEFKPCVVHNADLHLTEMLLEDTMIVWVPWGPYKGHAVDCGYSADGRLVGIKIWDDVHQRVDHKDGSGSTGAF